MRNIPPPDGAEGFEGAGRAARFGGAGFNSCGSHDM